MTYSYSTYLLGLDAILLVVLIHQTTRALEAVVNEDCLGL